MFLSFLFTVDKDVLKTFSSHNITFQEEKKRQTKTLGHKKKRMIHNKAKLILHKMYKKRESKMQREVNEANVEGDRYTIVRPNENDTYDTNPDKITREHLLSLSNTSDIDTIVNINMNQEKNIEDDKVAKIVSYCLRDFQCSKHATCIIANLKNEGFCRCLPSYYGPGIFCREEM